MLCRRGAGTPIQQRGFMSSEVIAILGVGVGLAALILSLAGLVVTLFIRSERRSQERHDRLEAQFHAFRIEIRAEWNDFRAEIRGDLATHRAEINGQLATHQEELAAHKSDTARQFAAVNARLDNLQTSLEQRFDAIERSQAKLEGQLEIIQGLLFQRVTIS